MEVGIVESKALPK